MLTDNQMQCPVCGKMFLRERAKPNQRYCSADCGKAAETAWKREYYERNRTLVNRRSDKCKKKKKQRKSTNKKNSNRKDIIAIDRQAKQEGLSYGRYVAKYGL